MRDLGLASEAFFESKCLCALQQPALALASAVQEHFQMPCVSFEGQKSQLWVAFQIGWAPKDVWRNILISAAFSQDDPVS